MSANWAVLLKTWFQWPNLSFSSKTTQNKRKLNKYPRYTVITFGKIPHTDEFSLVYFLQCFNAKQVPFVYGARECLSWELFSVPWRGETLLGECFSSVAFNHCKVCYDCQRWWPALFHIHYKPIKSIRSFQNAGHLISLGHR